MQEMNGQLLRPLLILTPTVLLHLIAAWMLSAVSIFLNRNNLNIYLLMNCFSFNFKVLDYEINYLFISFCFNSCHLGSWMDQSYFVASSLIIPEIFSVNDSLCRTDWECGMMDGRSGYVLIPTTRVMTWMDRVKGNLPKGRITENRLRRKARSRKK